VLNSPTSIATEAFIAKCAQNAGTQSLSFAVEKDPKTDLDARASQPPHMLIAKILEKADVFHRPSPPRPQQVTQTIPIFSGEGRAVIGHLHLRFFIRTAAFKHTRQAIPITSVWKRDLAAAPRILRCFGFLRSTEVQSQGPRAVPSRLNLAMDRDIGRMIPNDRQQSQQPHTSTSHPNNPKHSKLWECPLKGLPRGSPRILVWILLHPRTSAPHQLREKAQVPWCSQPQFMSPPSLESPQQLL